MFSPTEIDFTTAKCKSQPTIWWFPEWPPTKQKMKEWKQAKAICSECNMTVECLAYGKATNSYGIWGGVTLTNGKADYRKNRKK
jgi:hypothetical protein